MESILRPPQRSYISFPQLILSIFQLRSFPSNLIIYIWNQSKMDGKGKQGRLKSFQILSKLGEGSFGQVLKVRRRPDNEIYALKKIKTVSMNEKDRKNALNEVRILASYASEHIIDFKEAFYDDVSGNLCIVLEFAEKGDLMKRIGCHKKNKTHFEEEEIWKALIEMSLGLKSLHEKKIIHRDLKPANIFITAEGCYKIGDLNVSKILKTGLARTQTGTPYYASPEIWKDRPYGSKSDIWSLGCILYEMAALEPPFQARDISSLFIKVCEGTYPRIPLFYSNELSDLITSLLKQNPIHRPTTFEILNNPIVRKRFSHKYLRHFESNSSLPKSKNSISSPKLLETIKSKHGKWNGSNLNLPKQRYNLQAQDSYGISTDRNSNSKDKNSNKNKGKKMKEKPTTDRKSGSRSSSNKYIKNSMKSQKRKKGQLHHREQSLSQIQIISSQALSQACAPGKQNREKKLERYRLPPKPMKKVIPVTPSLKYSAHVPVKISKGGSQNSHSSLQRVESLSQVSSCRVRVSREKSRKRKQSLSLNKRHSFVA